MFQASWLPNWYSILILYNIYIQYIVVPGPYIYSGPCPLLAVVNDYKVRTFSALFVFLDFLVFVGFFICAFLCHFHFLKCLVFWIVCCRTLTNGSHSDYQVRTWFVLFALNPPSCRPDKEGPALSYFPLIEDRRVLLIGTLSYSADWGLKDFRL